ncbi:MAG: YifB family Mg chelatase-like AAA ATPase [Candidatus Paceibacterota bacterium]
MAVAKVYSAQNDINNSSVIEIESDLSRGLFSFAIVGLPDKAVAEAKDRVSAAIKNSGFDSPKSGNKKVVISLAPADIKKEGPSFDLPIALSYLLSSGEIKFDPKYKMFLGELALNGDVRKVKGVLPSVILAKKKGFREIFVPKENANEASLVDDIKVFGVNNLKEIINHFRENNSEFKKEILPWQREELNTVFDEAENDFAYIKGQNIAKRALEIAAAGGHNVLFYGPPGTGKTMLAKAFITILPDLYYEEMLDTTSIHSVAGILDGDKISKAPFRSPHHTSSHVAIVGGGVNLRPGEITLAHNGVLFLDEFPEFDRRVIESLREPLEEGKISVSRAKGTAVFPAKITLLAAMNPCPCGNYGSLKNCTCSAITIGRYQRKISGPILDRIDLIVPVEELKRKELSEEKKEISSKIIKEKIENARKFQKERFKKLGLKYSLNKDIKPKHIKEGSLIDEKAFKLLLDSTEKLSLSTRTFHRMIRVARTIADLENSEKITPSHILEALQFRGKISG